MIIILLADGFEEIEALTPLDMLRRAGITVKTVGIGGKIAVGSHGIPVVCDLLPDEVNLNDVSTVIFPGGMPGSLNLDASPFTDKVIAEITGKGGRLAAICAAPLILGRRGLLMGKKAVCYPGFENELVGAIVTDDDVITDGFITTAKGMGVALSFSKELISLILSPEKAAEISAAIMEPKITASDSNDSNELCFCFDKETENEEKGSDDLDLEFDNSVSPSGADYNNKNTGSGIETELQKNADTIIETLSLFGITASIGGFDIGTRYMRFEVIPAKGTKLNSMLALADDLALSLAKEGLRIEAPIPGKSAVGVEVPLDNPSFVNFNEILSEDRFTKATSPSTICLGKDVTGRTIISDIALMPHLIVGGAVGMGKTVFIQSMIASLLKKSNPDQLKMILLDSKKMEYSVYNELPNLLVPVISSKEEALAVLKWTVEESEKRYELFIKSDVRNLSKYNEKLSADPTLGKILPRIIIFADDLGEFMDGQKDEFESVVLRIVQKARAAGIHLVMSYHKCSPYSLSGVIRSNVPSRITFKTASHSDSRTIINKGGAEKLLGKGDALYMQSDTIGLTHLQTPFISDDDTEKIIKEYTDIYGKANYDTEVLSCVKNKINEKVLLPSTEDEEESENSDGILYDKQFLEAVDLAILSGKISTSLIQRKLSIGYGKAARFIDFMDDLGLISPPDGAKPRIVLITDEEWKEKLSRIKLIE